MQAAARSYRLNQTHEHCKVYYLFAEGTMEQTAVQLMSRKQRAAKLLTGDIGLTGLDALTEGEGGFEEALLEAIGRDETLFDPSQLFKAAGAVSEIDIEDAGYWNVEHAAASVDNADDRRTRSAHRAGGGMGATITPRSAASNATRAVKTESNCVPSKQSPPIWKRFTWSTDEAAWAKRRAELLALLDGGTVDEIAAWLTDHRIVFPGCEAEVAAKMVALAANHDKTEPQKPEPPHPVVVPKRKREPERQRNSFPRREPVYEEALTQQLALF